MNRRNLCNAIENALAGRVWSPETVFKIDIWTLYGYLL